MKYTHLSREERYQIHVLYRQGRNQAQIARALSRSRSTISRELKRNSAVSGYQPRRADAMAVQRQSLRRNARQLSALQWRWVVRYLRLYLSPEQISARLKLEQGLRVSAECIYQYIYRHKDCAQLVRYLRCQKLRRKRYASARQRRGQLKGRVGIEQRPRVVDERTRIGDWEGDTVIGKGHRGALVTLVERKSRYTLAAPVINRYAEVVAQHMIELLRPHKAQCKTITLDNGKEFAQHAFIAKCLGAGVFFAKPYCSWQRGLNENHNGLLRQFFPKRTDLTKVSREQVDDAVHLLNHRPRKCLGWRTPHEVFFGFEVQPLIIDHVAL